MDAKHLCGLFSINAEVPFYETQICFNALEAVF